MVIVLPQNDSIKNALEKKLSEYKGRLVKFEGVSLTKESNRRQIDSVYKIAIIEELLEKGEVDVGTMRTAMEGKYGFLDEFNYCNAICVIDDYCRTGGQNTWSGTGFPINK